MIVAMACTKNWYLYLSVILYSLFKHNKIEKAYLFIEDDNIPFLHDSRIEFINIEKLSEYIRKDSPNYNTHYTKMTFVRCYFSKVLKCDKILYIDADTLCIDSLEELWNLNLEDNVIAGVHEKNEWEKYLKLEDLNNTYINTGVMLMDLKKIREQFLDEQILYLINNIKYKYPDQDAINIVCKNRIKHITNKYNSCETTGIVKDAKIIHYIRDKKGWKEGSPRGEIWQKYYKEMLKGGVNNMEKNYKVKAKRNFDDYLGKSVDDKNSYVKREAGKSEWWVTKKRYEFLLDKKAIELVEVKKIEMPKTETAKQEVEPEKKEVKKTAKRETARKKEKYRS